MAGIANDILEARSLPAQNAAQWDHTYVATASGLSWGCFGRDSGGQLLISGAGNSAIADCLSYRRLPLSGANGTFIIYAGIVYAATGVCHQASNRILWPAQQLTLPLQTAGYSLSVYFWGVYGLRTWSEFGHCAQMNVVDGNGSFNQQLCLTAQTADRRSKAMTATSPGAPLSSLESVDDLRRFFHSRLEGEVEEYRIIKIYEIRKLFKERQDVLVGSLLNGEINKEVYLQEFASLSMFCMNSTRALLGEKNFFAVFGEIGYAPEKIIDEKIFLTN